MGPPEHRARALDLLEQAILDAALTGWVKPVWAPGPWTLRFEDRAIWVGAAPARDCWTDALLKAWWGDGGFGCC
jgi:hypothetical protein